MLDRQAGEGGKGLLGPRVAGGRARRSCRAARARAVTNGRPGCSMELCCLCACVPGPGPGPEGARRYSVQARGSASAPAASCEKISPALSGRRPASACVRAAGSPDATAAGEGGTAGEVPQARLSRAACCCGCSAPAAPGASAKAGRRGGQVPAVPELRQRRYRTPSLS